MKTLSCDLCDREFSAETFEEWFAQMIPHYKQDHADFMAASANKPKSEGEKWMADARARFETTKA